MAHTKGFWNIITSAADLKAEAQPGEPLVELVADNRILIENHMGVIGYDSEQIRVKVKFGQLIVIGSALMLSRMSKEQLLITGCIDSLQLCRREY